MVLLDLVKKTLDGYLADVDRVEKTAVLRATIDLITAVDLKLTALEAQLATLQKVVESR